MADDEAHRFSDELLVRLDQKLTDHLEWAKQEQVSMNIRVSNLESFVKTIEKPVAAAGWSIIVFMGAFISAIALFLWKFLTTKVHWGT